MPSGIFKPYSGVQTAILLFDKLNKKDGSGTDKVWLYNMEADGFSLDDKRNEIKDNDIPDIINRFNNLELENSRTPYDKSFFVSIDDIRKNNYVLRLKDYKKTHTEKKEYRPTKEIYDSLIESEIQSISILKEASNDSYKLLISKIFDMLSQEEINEFIDRKKS